MTVNIGSFTIEASKLVDLKENKIFTKDFSSELFGGF